MKRDLKKFFRKQKSFKKFFVTYLKKSPLMFAMECEVDVRVWFPVVFVSLHFLSRKDNMNLLNGEKIFLPYKQVTVLIVLQGCPEDA